MRFSQASLLVAAIFWLGGCTSDTPPVENVESIDVDLSQDRQLFEAEANQDTPEKGPDNSSEVQLNKME